jgi:ubiquitin carboxyl-terminal hydrolase 2/21
MQPVATMTTPMPTRGLANVGNTCYLNSAIQLLRHAEPLRRLFADDGWKRWRHEDRKALALTDETAALVAALNSPADDGVRALVPRKFAAEFVRFGREFNDEIAIGAQADAAEAVQILLDALHTQLGREVRMQIHGDKGTREQVEMIRSLESWTTFFRKEYSPIIEHFFGQTQATVVCDGCNGKSTRYEPWSVLKLPIPGADKAGSPAPTLQECLAANFATESLDDYQCDGCKARGPARIHHAMSRFPDHIILSLKRFTNTGAKVRARIPYDEHVVDLSMWRAWPTLQGLQRYRVAATIEHLGGSRGGHYCMRAKEGDKWYTYDDGQVHATAAGGQAGPDTYMLLLERI